MPPMVISFEAAASVAKLNKHHHTKPRCITIQALLNYNISVILTCLFTN